MLSKQDKLKSLAKVINSTTFAHSPTSSALLQFLVTSTIEGQYIKEATIGIELLGKSYDPEKSNARVRVNVYNLRKKLNSYYKTEGKNDLWLITIEKGQYLVSFEPRNDNTSLPPNDKNKHYKYLWSTIAILILLLCYTTFKPYYTPTIPIWSCFFKNHHATTLFIGDFFGIMGKTSTGSTGWNRDYNINSLEEFYAFCEAHPELKNEISAANYNYVTGMSAIATKHLTKLFAKQKQDFLIRFTNTSHYQDINAGNAIYVGATKNNNKFIGLFNDHNKHFDFKNDTLIYHSSSQNNDTSFYFDSMAGDSEYALVVSQKGADDTEQLMFFSNHDMGVMATVDYFTNTDSLQVFANTYLVDKPYFTALYLVKGKERTNMELEMVLIDIEP
ncbi:helix-turn-helix domain-containing protein [Flammeovirgaceae bacterium SG7u.111]|nr:helix-turn-helix domain-containing protein [Flammeovirgaceae bacterium SG7u.132]WPO38430.1 helix-turn-helix domain-containing protein [Flammeovirgaceae bacterium SG7u.111]